MDWLCKNKGHDQPSLNMQHTLHFYICLVPLPLREEVAVQDNQQVSHHYELNLIMSPHRA